MEKDIVSHVAEFLLFEPTKVDLKIVLDDFRETFAVIYTPDGDRKRVDIDLTQIDLYEKLLKLNNIPVRICFLE